MEQVKFIRECLHLHQNCSAESRHQQRRQPHSPLFGQHHSPLHARLHFPTPRPTPQPTLQPIPHPLPASSAACSAWPACSNLDGDCCPTSDGVWLDCCQGQITSLNARSQQVNTQIPEYSDNRTQFSQGRVERSSYLNAASAEKHWLIAFCFAAVSMLLVSMGIVLMRTRSVTRTLSVPLMGRS